jgi:AhpD family alkylhydroperoxidase
VALGPGVAGDPVANVNECDYCQAADTGAAKAQGFSEEETLQIRRGAIDGGWSDVERLDADADVVRTIPTNYFNHLVGTELDLPPASSLD